MAKIKYVSPNSASRVVANVKTLLNSKVSKVTGKGLSTNDYTNEEKAKLGGLPDNVEANAQVNVIETVKVNGTALAVTNKAVDVSIPTNTNQLTNGAGFITIAVADLANYYLKSETYTKEEIGQLITAIPKFKIQVVTTLPASNISETTVYLVSNSGSGTNIYDEYIYTNNAWEKLGTQNIDLSGYVQTTRKINNKALTNDITLTAADVGALPADTSYATPAQVNAKYTKPTGGIPKTDLATSVQTSLDLADSALQDDDFEEITTAEVDAMFNNS